MPNIPEKRKNPFEKTLTQMRDEQTKKEEAKETTSQVEAKPVARKKKEQPKAASTKTTASKTATKKATTKATTKKAAPKKPAKVKIDAKTGVAKVVESKAKATTKKAVTKTTTKKAAPKTEIKKTTTKRTTKATKPVENVVSTTPQVVSKTPQVVTETPQVVTTPVVDTPIIVETPVEEIVAAPQTAPVAPEVPVKKPRKISKRAQLLKEQKAAERAAAKAAKMVPVVIVRPEPKKFKLATKEEKAQYKKLEESFDYLTNLASVVEEKTMNKDAIPDITLGELHVIQMVKKFNNKPMTLIANNLKVTVGSLITCLNRLIQKDYIIRTRDEMDNRVILLSVTPKAQAVLKAHDKFHDDILGLLLENGVTLAQATKVLSTLNTVLEVYYDPIHNSFTKEEKGSKAKKK